MDVRTAEMNTMTAHQSSDQLQLLMAAGAAIAFILIVVIIMLIYAVIKTSSEATRIRKLLESHLEEITPAPQIDSSAPRE